jgi:hypothetical protein
MKTNHPKSGQKFSLDVGEYRGQLSGVANSGEMIDRGGYRVIIDFSGASVPDRIPVLHVHDSSNEVGFCSAVVENFALVVTEGELLSNERAQTIRKNSEDGFPYGFSVGITGKVDFVESGKKTVNGVEHEAPFYVFSEVRVLEISITGTPADAGAVAEIFDAQSSPASIELSAAKAENEQLKSQLAQLKLSLEAHSKEIRKSRLFGLSLSEDTQKKLLSLEQDAFDTSLAALIELQESPAKTKAPPAVHSNAAFSIPDGLKELSLAEKARNLQKAAEKAGKSLTLSAAMAKAIENG